jgi:hypothetical protein
MTRIKVTAENFQEVHGMVLASDMAAEIAVGQEIETWPITHEGCQRGQMTVFHDVNRAAVAFGGPSIWGDWDEKARILHADYGVDYNELGEEIEAYEDDEDDE